MNATDGSEGRGYNDLYKDFDSPLMQQLRLEAYEKDIGQHSWVTAEGTRTGHSSTQALSLQPFP